MFELLHDVLEDGVRHVADEQVLLRVGLRPSWTPTRRGFRNRAGRRIAGHGSVIRGFRNGGGRGGARIRWFWGRCSGFQEPFWPPSGGWECVLATKMRFWGQLRSVAGDFRSHRVLGTGQQRRGFKVLLRDMSAALSGYVLDPVRGLRNCAGVLDKCRERSDI